MLTSCKNISLNKAETSHLKEICKLVNLAYRGQMGWTKETEIVEGHRTTHADIKQLIDADNSDILLYETKTQLISCIHIAVDNKTAQIGLFAVHPNHQAQGVGKAILTMAEDYARKTYQTNYFSMLVVSQRKELIAYYERRGYKASDVVEDYHRHADVGIPKIDGLTITTLIKPDFKN